ncbi:MAG: Holliday junction branch migration protein RuvA [Tissierellia bacterium]|nr:Holliday junction branch migration protein RuvA [Tissierellia bacterium]
MIEYIYGRVIRIKEDFLILENNGIGYKIFTSNETLFNVKEGEDAEIRTFLSVKEDGFTLYGFYTEEELELFKLLTSVSKVGPKTALSVLSSLGLSKTVLGLKTEDASILSQAPGIGKKTAERLILELKDKVENFTADIKDIGDKLVSTVNSKNKDIYIALEGLGFSRGEIDMALNEVNLEELTVEKAIKEAIKMMGHR